MLKLYMIEKVEMLEVIVQVECLGFSLFTGLNKSEIL